MGQVVDTRTDKSSSISMNLSAQEKGIYFIEIEAEDKSISRGKIVLLR
jgi:tRNA threonylcarbamoyladenosine modification (KEOPS) complex  Pcc1 subunit